KRRIVLNPRGGNQPFSLIGKVGSTSDRGHCGDSSMAAQLTILILEARASPPVQDQPVSISCLGLTGRLSTAPSQMMELSRLPLRNFNRISTEMGLSHFSPHLREARTSLGCIRLLITRTLP